MSACPCCHRDGHGNRRLLVVEAVLVAVVAVVATVAILGLSGALGA